MKRALCILLAAAVAVVAGASGVAAASPGSLYSARLSGCHRSIDPTQRSVDVDSGMFARVPGTRRMAIRFDLYERAGGQSRFARVPRDAAGRLFVWVRSPQTVHNPGTFFERTNETFLQNRTVPAAYFFRVGFRWYGRRGQVLRQRFLTTGVCLQPDMRPDLRVRSVSAHPQPDGSARYDAVIRNGGLTRAGAFSAVLQSAGMTVAGQSRMVPGLAPGAAVTVSFVGPACTASAPPTVVVDPDNRVNERDEQNNSRPATCG